jgi:hypothetical protein
VKHLLATCLLAVCTGLVYADDEVTYLDRATGKEEKIFGTIQKEGPGGIRIKEKRGGAVKDVPALNVVQVNYQQTKVDVQLYKDAFAKERVALRATKAAERKDRLQKALEAYRNLARQLREDVRAHRYVQYKVCEVLAHQAKDDPKVRDEAIAALAAFKRDHGSGWQVLPALNLLAQLQEEGGKLEDALKTYQELADVPDVPRDVKQTSDVLIGQLLLRNRKWPEAEKKWRALQAPGALPEDRKPAALAYLAQSLLEQKKPAEVEKLLTQALGTARDDTVKALAHNLLGDYFLQKRQPEDAFWHYLRVDALYGQDRGEHAKALYHLARLYDSVRGDKVRAGQCRERLLDKQFEGVEYHQRAMAEK